MMKEMNKHNKSFDSYLDSLNNKEKNELETSARKWDKRLSKSQWFFTLLDRLTLKKQGVRLNKRAGAMLFISILLIPILALWILLRPPHYSKEEIAANEKNFMEQINNMHPYEQEFYDALAITRKIDENMYERVIAIPRMEIDYVNQEEFGIMTTIYKNFEITGHILTISETYLERNYRDWQLAALLIHEMGHMEQKESSKLRQKFNLIYCHPWLNPTIHSSIYSNYNSLVDKTEEICSEKVVKQWVKKYFKQDPRSDQTKRQIRIQILKDLPNIYLKSHY